jgi:cell division protein FtsL
MSAKRLERVRRASQFVLDTLSGRLGVLMMTLSYASFAVVLLAYVSTQVYTDSLMEDITGCKREERELKERIGRLTAQYAALSARARVSAYCEDKLGMIEADVTQIVRVVIDGDDEFSSAEDFTSEPVWIPDVLGSEIGDLTEVMQR